MTNERLDKFDDAVETVCGECSAQNCDNCPVRKTYDTIHPTTEERIANIGAFKKRKDEEANAKAKAEADENARLREAVYALHPRIDALLKVAQACRDNGIPIGPKDPLGCNKPYEGSNFVMNGIYHRVGFPRRGEPLDCIGFLNGGACGHWNFYTNGYTSWEVNEVSKVTQCWVSNDNLKHFLKDFDEFETKFYAYVDRITKK